MKKFLALYFLFFICQGHTQTKVNLKFYDPCSDVIFSEYQMVSLDKTLKDHWISDPDSLVIIQPGIYSIWVVIEDGNNAFKSHTFTKQFIENRIYLDTLELPKILKKYTAWMHNQTDLGFYYCDTVCDGYLTEYYENGQKKVEGTFENGKPIKQIKYYNKKGELVEIAFYNKNGRYRKSKYPDYRKYISRN